MATFSDKFRLLQGLLTRETALAGPFAITVDVTRRCNLKCIGCAIHSPCVEIPTDCDPAIQDLDVDMFERLCRELKMMGTRTLVFCGDGEPLLHPRFFELAQLARGSGFRTVLLTNGTLIDETMAQDFSAGPIDLLRISLWASSPEEYRKNYPGTKADYFTKVIDGLRFLAAAKEARGSRIPHVALHRVINRINFRNIDSYVDLALETDCDSVSFSPLHTIFGQLNSFSLSREEEDILIAQLLRAKEKLSSLEMEHNIEETIYRYEVGAEVRRNTPCYVPWMQCRMKVDGTVRPCNPCRWPVGNFRHQSFREIWNSDSYRSFRRKISSPAHAAGIDGICDCSFCCYLADNMRVHRFYKYLSPFSRIFARSIARTEY